MTRWEYIAVDSDAYDDHSIVGAQGLTKVDTPRILLLNQLGADGWELVTVQRTGFSIYYTFKRPVA